MSSLAAKARFAQIGKGPTFLQITSDIDAGLPVTLHSFIPDAQLPAIRAMTSTYDCTSAINTALGDIGVKRLVIPPGLHNYSGNLTRVTGAKNGIMIRGESTQHSILRAMGAGGLVFDGGNVTDNFDMPVMNLKDLRLEAGVANAGTAVRMFYTGGSGTPPIGPQWSDIVIAPAGNSLGPGTPGFNIGVHGTNLRDVHGHRITIMGTSTAAGHPIVPTMTEGFLFDGEDDPVELWFSELYGCFMDTLFKVRGHWEGVYLDRVTTLALWTVLDWHANTPQPTGHITNSYLGSEKFGLKIDMVSYFNISGTTFNATAPVPTSDYVGIEVNRSDIPGVSNQTLISRIHDNLFIGTDYKTRSGGTYQETGVHVISGNTLDIVGNKMYDIERGVVVNDQAINTGIKSDNNYISVPIPELIPARCRTIGQREIQIRVQPTGSDQVIATNTPTKLVMTEIVEIDGSDVYYDTTTSRATLPEGLWEFDGQIRYGTGAIAGDFCYANLYKNGVMVRSTGSGVNYTGTVIIPFNFKEYSNGSDYFEIWAEVESGSGGTRVVSHSSLHSWLNITPIR